MALTLNPIQAFKDSFKLTEMPLKDKKPSNTRDCLFISEVDEDGIFKVENKSGECLYDKVYVFSDVNYVNLDEGERNSLLQNLMQMLNYMSTDFKITVSNEYQNASEFIDHTYKNINESEYPRIASGMNRWIKEKVKEAKLPNINRLLYLTITVRANTHDEANSYFNQRQKSLEDFFRAFNSRIYPLTGAERLESIRKFFYRDEDHIPIRFDVPGRDPVNDVVPVSLDASNSNFFTYNENRYVSVLFARNVDSGLRDLDSFYCLSDVEYPSLVTVDYAPVNKNLLKGMLERSHLNNERSISSEIDARRKNGQIMAGVSYNKERKKDELEEYIDQVDDNNEHCVLASVLVVVTADSEKELGIRVESMKEKAKEAGFMLDTYNWVQLKAFNTALPIGCRLVKYKRSYLTSSAVALHPFHAQDLIEPGGFFMGMNRTTFHPVIANRKTLKSPQGMIVGHTGSGKSFLIKETEISQTLSTTNDDLTIIDPQNEYEGVCADYGGTFIDMTPKSKTYMNPLEIPNDLLKCKNTTECEKFIGDVADWARSFISAILEGHIYTSDHGKFIEKALVQIYQKAFDNQVSEMPTLRNLRDTLVEYEKESKFSKDIEKIHQMTNALDPWVDGSYDLFAHPSNVDMNSRMVCFGLANVSQRIWEPVMITIMAFLSNRLEYNQSLQRATRFIVDETQVVTANDMSAQMLLRAMITYRKYGGIVTLALQNVTRALQNPDLRESFSNCGYKCFLDSGGVDANNLATVQKLSSTEFEALSEPNPGYCLIIWGDKKILLDTTMSKDNPLYDDFSTNFHERAEKKAKN
jgi:type IV secretory pathway VirB4 component